MAHTVSVEVRVTPWIPLWFPSDDYAAVRIWKMHDPQFGRWWQCHEWERKGGNRERVSDGWIPGTRGWGAATEPPQDGEKIPRETA